MSTATRIPGPPELLPGGPDAVVDLQTAEGVALVRAEWRYADAGIVETDFVEVGTDLGPTGPPNRTYDVVPHAQGAAADDSTWRRLEPHETQLRLSTGLVCFNWYRINVTLPRGSATSTRPEPPSFSKSSSTTTRRCGSTASCQSR